MTTATLPAPPPAGSTAPPAGPQPKRWTVAQFHQLGDLGVFEGRRAMLIDGVIVEEGPMNPPHAIATTLVADALRTAFGAGWFPRVQMPVVLGPLTDPEPDVAVVPGTARDYTTHPTTAALVVEVADTSLAYDLGEKASLYAAGGIADYWVLDVAGRVLHVFRDPRPDAAQPHGHGYAQHQTFAPGQAVAPLAASGVTVNVADLLP